MDTGRDEVHGNREGMPGHEMGRGTMASVLAMTDGQHEVRDTCGTGCHSIRRRLISVHCNLLAQRTQHYAGTCLLAPFVPIVKTLAQRTHDNT